MNRSDSTTDSSNDQIRSGRLLFLGTSVALTNTAVMWYYYTTFYSRRESERTAWHTFNDWYNADMNLDKIGHVYGSQLYANTLYHLFRWSRMDETPAMYWSSGIAWILQLEMETTDAFYKKWGFSWWDVAANTIGAVYPNLQRKYPVLESFNLKMSYHPTQAYKDQWIDYVLKDYDGFTYWLAFSVYDFMPASVRKFWFPWLGFAVGYGIQNSVIGKNQFNTDINGKGAGDQEWYIALDYDLRKLPGDSAFLKFLKEELNFFHLPAPAIRITPHAVFYGFYF